MSEFSRYIASPHTASISADEVSSLVRRYPWFSAARRVEAHLSGCVSPVEQLLSECRNGSLLDMQGVDIERLVEETEGEIIDRFLRLDDYRIVAESDGAEEDITIEAEFDDEDDLVSEDLAEVYLAQGLKSAAIEIYRKLSLLNPEKSIYFAEKIEKLEKTK